MTNNPLIDEIHTVREMLLDRAGGDLAVAIAQARVFSRSLRGFRTVQGKPRLTGANRETKGQSGATLVPTGA